MWGMGDVNQEKKVLYNIKTRKSALRGTYTPGWCPFLSINIF